MHAGREGYKVHGREGESDGRKKKEGLEVVLNRSLSLSLPLSHPPCCVWASRKQQQRQVHVIFGSEGGEATLQAVLGYI